MEEEQKDRVFVFPDEHRLAIPAEDLEYIFRGFRPRLMSIEDFKFISKILKKELKIYLEGKLVHIAKVNGEVWNEYIKGMKHKPRQRGNTYVRKDK